MREHTLQIKEMKAGFNSWGGQKTAKTFRCVCGAGPWKTKRSAVRHLKTADRRPAELSGVFRVRRDFVVGAQFEFGSAGRKKRVMEVSGRDLASGVWVTEVIRDDALPGNLGRLRKFSWKELDKLNIMQTRSDQGKR